LRAHVLYIEDDDVVRGLFAECLRRADLIVVEEGLAERALDTLNRVHPDVILLDLGMPVGRMSGIEMLARLRDVPEWAQVPVVVLSGFGDVVNADIMARLNVSHVLTKTDTHGDEVGRLIGEIIQRRARQSGRSVDAPERTPTPPSD
jgi:CheY-like chemotaxis protein